MPLPEFTKKLIKAKLSKYCINRIPGHARDKVKLIFDINGNKVTLIGTRPYYRDPSIWTESPVAQFRFDNDKKQWLLYFSDLNNRWHLYDLIQPSTNFDDLLKEEKNKIQNFIDRHETQEMDPMTEMIVQLGKDLLQEVH